MSYNGQVLDPNYSKVTWSSVDLKTWDCKEYGQPFYWVRNRHFFVVFHENLIIFCSKKWCAQFCSCLFKLGGSTRLLAFCGGPLLFSEVIIFIVIFPKVLQHFKKKIQFSFFFFSYIFLIISRLHFSHFNWNEKEESLL